MKQQVSKLNYLHIAPRKVRLVTDALKGLPVQEAEAELMLRPNRASKPILKLLKSAVSNAKNNKLNPNNLVIVNIRVDKGPMLKRFLPRAMGRATPLQKKMSHITLVLEENLKLTKERFTITPPIKKDAKKKEKAKKLKKPEFKPEKQEKADKPKREKTGIFKRFFRRKSV